MDGCSCCPLCAGKCVTLVRTYNFVKKLVRWIALGDAVFGLIILVAIITDRSLRVKVDFTTLSDDQKTVEIVKLVILCLFGCQILFSLILHEGARREILWMIKAWLVFCLMKLTIQTISLTRYLTSSREQISKGDIQWMKFINIAATLYGFVEAVVILIFHHHIQMEQAPSDEKDSDDVEQVQNDENDARVESVPLSESNPVVIMEDASTNVSVPIRSNY